MTENIEDLDLYGILGLSITASTNEIRRAYKKEALKCHPDKNPDNPKAPELFKRLTKVLKILLDGSARAAYDQHLKAKEAAKLRHSALDKQRKRFKEQLDERERASSESLSYEEKLKREVERLEKEGSKLLEEEILKLQEEVLRSEDIATSYKDAGKSQIKVSWVVQSDKCDLYTQETLQKIFSKFGTVTAVAVAGNKAIIEFDDARATELAIKIEIGFLENPLKVKPFEKGEKSKSRKRPHQNPFDRESLTARSDRQAAERKRLIDEMLREDNGK